MRMDLFKVPESKANKIYPTEDEKERYMNVNIMEIKEKYQVYNHKWHTTAKCDVFLNNKLNKNMLKETQTWRIRF